MGEFAEMELNRGLEEHLDEMEYIELLEGDETIKRTLLDEFLPFHIQLNNDEYQ